MRINYCKRKVFQSNVFSSALREKRIQIKSIDIVITEISFHEHENQLTIKDP